MYQNMASSRTCKALDLVLNTKKTKEIHLYIRPYRPCMAVLACLSLVSPDGTGVTERHLSSVPYGRAKFKCGLQVTLVLQLPPINKHVNHPVSK